MKLSVLGCSGTYPGPGSPCSGYLVEHDGFRLVLDLGNGALGGLLHHVDLLDVDAVYVSHLHGDHCLDLVPYSYARRYHPDGAAPPLPVYGPVGLAERILGSYESPPEDGLDEVYAFHELPAGDLRLGPFQIRTAVVAHPVESHAARLTADGRSLVYSSDTGTSASLVELARGCDVLLCEASWPSDPPPPPGIHLTGGQAGEHAAQAGVGRLLLTHLMPSTAPGPVLQAARAAYHGPVELVSYGCTYDI